MESSLKGDQINIGGQLSWFVLTRLDPYDPTHPGSPRLQYLFYQRQALVSQAFTPAVKLATRAQYPNLGLSPCVFTPFCSYLSLT